jgi:hypothetical protein
MRYILLLLPFLFLLNSCATKECKCECKCPPCEKQTEKETKKEKKGEIHFKNPFSDDVNIRDILK